MISHQETVVVPRRGGRSVLRAILTRSRLRLQRQVSVDEGCAKIVESGALQGLAPDDAAWIEWADQLHPADASLMRHSLEYAAEHGDDAPLSYV